ncbi:MAG: guanine deaminase [Geminicoccaceae bacterium]|nr:guanine deaminase [Geminicoccaceae bacterium]
MSGTGPAPRRRAIRGRLLDFPPEGGHRLRADHLVLVEDGRIARLGPAAELLPTLPPDTPVDAHGDRLVLPGLIDAHIHFPQSQVIASPAEDLLDWLERHTFPAERAFGDPAHAARMASFFLDELLRQGTTTAVVYGSVHAASIEAVLTEARVRRLRLLAGKVMMDRGPEGLRDTVEEGVRESAELIARWHGVDRLGYVISPRFALTSSEAQLAAAGELLAAHPSCWLQTHLAESPGEIEAVRARFPWAPHYTAVYDRFGLLGPRTLLGHCVHLREEEQARLAETGSVAVLCPTSNLFLGSGLVDLGALADRRRPVRLALGTDVGGGSSWSMLRTAATLCDVARLLGRGWSPVDAFRLMTIDNAAALGLADRIGRLEPGFEADLVVLDPAATPAMAHRLERAHGLEDELAVLLRLGDDRAVRCVYVLGEPVAGADLSVRR